MDSDGDEMPDDDDEAREYYGYRVWYSLEIHVKPAAPERVLEVTCACQVGYVSSTSPVGYILCPCIKRLFYRCLPICLSFCPAMYLFVCLHELNMKISHFPLTPKQN